MFRFVSGMRSRPMAAFLVLMMVSWVGSFAQTADTSVQTSPVAQSTPDGHHTHNCCGPLGAFLVRPTLPEKPAGMPCGDEHPCCVRPGPQNTPNLPSSCGQQESSEGSVRVFAASEEDPMKTEADGQTSTRRTFKFSTVLRI